MDDITGRLSGDASGGQLGGGRDSSASVRSGRATTAAADELVVDMPPDHQRNGARHRIANGHGSILPRRSPTA